MSTIIGECSICFCHLDCADDNICVLHCGHVFHSPCLNQWIADQPTCPQCRLPVNRRKPIVKHLYLNLPQQSIDEKNESEANTAKALHQLDLGQQKNTHLREEIYLLQSQVKEHKSSNKKLSDSVTNLQGELRKSISERNQSVANVARTLNQSEANGARTLNQLNVERNNHKKTNKELSEVKTKKKEVGRRLNEQAQTTNQLRKEIDLLEEEVNELQSANKRVESLVVANLQRQLQQSLNKNKVQENRHVIEMLSKSKKIDDLEYIRADTKKELQLVRYTMQDDNNLIRQKLEKVRHENDSTTKAHSNLCILFFFAVILILYLYASKSGVKSSNKQLSDSVTNLQEELRKSIGEKNHLRKEIDLLEAEVKWQIKIRSFLRSLPFIW